MINIPGSTLLKLYIYRFQLGKMPSRIIVITFVSSLSSTLPAGLTSEQDESVRSTSLVPSYYGVNIVSTGWEIHLH